MVSYVTKGEEIDGETKGEGRERRERTNKDTKKKPHTHEHTCWVTRVLHRQENGLMHKREVKGCLFKQWQN